MTQGRVYLGAAAVCNNLYAVGGCDYSGQALSSVEVLDVRMGSWRRAANLELNRTYLSALAIPAWEQMQQAGEQDAC